MATQRIATNQSALLEARFYSTDLETLANDTPVTVTITRPDGTALVSGAATTNSGTGIYQYTLAAQTNPTRLAAVWTGASGKKVSTYVEVVGDYYFNLADLRAADGLTSASTYPTATLRSARDRAEQFVEDVTGVSWVPRFAREKFSGNGTRVLLLGTGDTWRAPGEVRRRYYPRSLISVTENGTAVTDLTEFRLYDDGRLFRGDAIWDPPDSEDAQNITVEYLFGKDSPPEDLRYATLRLARHLALGTNSRIDERASMMTTDFGSIQLVTAGARRPTGLPEVDAILGRYNHHLPGVA